MTDGTAVRDAARDVHGSTVVDRLARLGLAARGVVWLVVGLLALSVLLGGDEQTDRDGALGAIAARPYGGVLLVVLVVGFAGYAAWRALSAAVGHREDEGRARLGKRALSAAKAVLYGFLAVSTLRFLLVGGGQGDRAPSLTAAVMERPGGRALVGLVGVAVIGVGLAVVVRAALQKHAKKLEQYRVPDRLRAVVRWVGTAGLSGRGLVLALIGVFLVRAAVAFDPAEAKGLDAALQALAAQPYGRAMLGVAVVGMLAYAGWSILEAVFRRI